VSEKGQNRRQARPKALGYLRVSTVEQTQGFGLDVQEKAIRDYCKANGLRLTAIHRDEGISGSNGLDSRQGLATALVKLEAGEASTLVVYRLDRLARDLILQETLVTQLREQGTPVRSASEPDLDTDTDDPTKTLIRQIIGAVSQYERAVIRGRMQGGKAAKARKGGYTGGRPSYGYATHNKELVPNESEQEMVQLVHKLHRAGKSLREIALQLDQRRFRPRNGQRWHPNTIRRIIQSSPPLLATATR
jgi:DNA invertase Pin-like site-specific DNA recombinase